LSGASACNLFMRAAGAGAASSVSLPSLSPDGMPAMSELKPHQLSMTVLMTPEMANFSGKVHGGAILRLLDQVAYACASRYAGCVVTLSVDQVMFRQPINVGELVTFLASVNFTGTSSLEVGVKVVAEDILKHSVRHANSCFFTMVAVDDDGKPTPVPALQPQSADELRRHAAAQIRRQLRQEMEQRQLALLASTQDATKPAR
jgi:acyl-CoA hydrolase